jgi:pSer/pThr/pTyr-binding forkhead associated (FHA) protein
MGGGDSKDDRYEATRVVAASLLSEGLVDSDDEPERTMLIASPFAIPAAPRAPQASLVAVEGNDRGKKHPLSGRVQVVGRSLDCDIVLNDPSVSRRHFEVSRSGTEWLMGDLGSGNGTRVDGERVPTARLSAGTRIEAGQTVLEFQLDGPVQDEDAEATRAVDIRRDRISAPASHPEPMTLQPDATRTLRQADPPSPEQIRLGPSPRIEVTALPSDQPRFPLWQVIGGVSLATLLVIAVAQFGFQIRILPIGDATTSVVPRPEAPPVEAESPDQVARGMKAIDERQWDAAIGIFSEVISKGSTVAGVEDALQLARDEKRNSSLLDAAKGALERAATDEARGLLVRIAATSVYVDETKRLLAGLDLGHITADIETVKSAAHAGHRIEARQGFVALVTDHPEDPRLLPLRDELVAAGVALDPPPARPADPAVAAVASPEPAQPLPEPAAAVVTAPTATIPPARSGRLDLARVLSLYDRGLFQQAVSDLKSLRTKGDELSKSQGLAERIERFSDAFGEGKTGLAGKRLDRAEGGLTAALKLDKEINGHYQDEIRGLLGDTFRSRAASAIQNANYVLAAQSTRRALSFRAEDDLARSILDKCLVIAQKQYDAAVVDSRAGRKDAAREKAQVVLDILEGSADHPLADKAAALLR